MRCFNKVILVGNLTRDPELRYTSGGIAVTNFSIAVNRAYTTKSGEKKEEVSFFDIAVWRKLAENCGEFLKKGSAVLVEGRLKEDRWEGEDGNRHSKVKVEAYDVVFLSSKEGRTSAIKEEEAFSPPPQPPAEGEETPF